MAMRLLFALLASFSFVGCAPSSNTEDGQIAPHEAACSSGPTASGLRPYVLASEISAARYANEEWEALASLDATLSPLPSELTPRHLASPYSEGFESESVPAWKGSQEELTRAFEASRDERRYVDSASNMNRRATWLYPYDGCASRSAHVVRHLRRSGFAKPAKLYAFGNLRARTPYQRGGTIFWWYHTAPAYRIDGTIFVFDAALDPKQPLELDEWMHRLSPNPEKVKLAVCDANAFNAKSICRGGSEDQDRDYDSNIRSYLRLEWRNLETLGFDPHRLLGDEPPWVKEPEKISEARCEQIAEAALSP